MQYVVYRITNLNNKRVYIGSSSQFEVRKLEHLGQLRKGVHVNRFLQKDFAIYGEAAFVFDIISDEFKTRQAMLIKEYEWILKTKDIHYNIGLDCPVINLNTRANKNRKMLSKRRRIKVSKKVKKIKVRRAKKVKTVFPMVDAILERKRLREESKLSPFVLRPIQ